MPLRLHNGSSNGVVGSPALESNTVRQRAALKGAGRPPTCADVLPRSTRASLRWATVNNTARASLLAALLCFSSTAHAIQIGGITLTDLGAGVVPNAINNIGQVVGQDASGQAFLWQAGMVAPLGTLGGTQSAANDINDNGLVVGWANSASGLQHAFKYSQGAGMADLMPGVAYESVAEAANINSEIAGWIRSGSQTRSAIWYNSGPGFAPLFGNFNSKAMGINDRWQVVGVRLDTSGQPILGYYWNGISTSEWTTGYGDYYPLGGINNSGVTAGRHLSGAAYLTIGELGQNDIGSLDIYDLLAECRGLNNGGLMVGLSGDKAFLFDMTDRSLFNLNNFLPTGSPFTQLTVANDINDSGAFVGMGLVGGVQHGFVGQVTITPEPSTLALLLIATVSAAALRCFRRRRAISA